MSGACRGLVLGFSLALAAGCGPGRTGPATVSATPPGETSGEEREGVRAAADTSPSRPGVADSTAAEGASAAVGEAGEVAGTVDSVEVQATDPLRSPPEAGDSVGAADSTGVPESTEVADSSGVAESTGAAGEVAEEAERAGAPEVRGPVRRPASPVPVLPGAVLPRQRIVAFYGHAGSRRMGILGELPPDSMLARLDAEVRRWEEADPATPVRPALHVIATMATGDPGDDGKYRLRMPSALIERVLEWAERREALVFLDIQPGRSEVVDELPRLRRWLELPNVHLALDPEWNMPEGGVPGKIIGSMDAAEVNVAVEFLAELVEEHDLPPKVLVVHRFTQRMLPDPWDIETDPRVQLVVNMDGWGPPAQKLNTFRTIVAPEVPQWAGFKLFFKNDRWGGNRMLTPAELLVLNPVPVYIQYQ